MLMNVHILWLNIGMIFLPLRTNYKKKHRFIFTRINKVFKTFYLKMWFRNKDVYVIYAYYFYIVLEIIKRQSRIEQKRPTQWISQLQYIWLHKY